MTSIISFQDKLKRTREKKERLVRKEKILAVQKILRCTRCPLKCEKCGGQIEDSYQGHKDQLLPKIPYRFCNSCTDEYWAYINRMKGCDNPSYYWHNDAWLRLWQSWIDYQSAMDRYTQSSEFQQLLSELRLMESE